MDHIYGVRHVLVQHMDSATRAVWRQTNKRANQDVCEAATTLTHSAGLCHALPQQLFAKCPRLRRLVVSDALDLNGMPASIEVLELRTCSSRLDWSPLLTCTNLRKLSIYSHHDEQPAALAPVLQCLCSLQQLELQLGSRDGSCPDAVRTAVLPAIGALTQLCQLDISGQHLGMQGAAALMPVLLAIPCLQQLSLGGNDLSVDCIEVLAPALTALTELRLLELHRNDLGMEGAAALAPVLPHLSKLQGINLGLTSLGPAGAAALAPALQCLTNLVQLDLSRNDIGVEGLAALAPAFSSLSGMLRDLDLSSNAFGSTAESTESCAQALGAIAAATNLTHLYLGHNELGAEGVAALHRTLSSLSSLSHLDLSGNSFGSDANIQPALEAVAAARSLQVLDLACSELCNADSAWLLSSVLDRTKLPHLRCVNLRSNCLCADGISFLTKATVHAAPRVVLLTDDQLEPCSLSDSDDDSVQTLFSQHGCQTSTSPQGSVASVGSKRCHAPDADTDAGLDFGATPKRARRCSMDAVATVTPMLLHASVTMGLVSSCYDVLAGGMQQQQQERLTATCIPSMALFPATLFNMALHSFPSFTVGSFDLSPLLVQPTCLEHCAHPCMVGTGDAWVCVQLVEAATGDPSDPGMLCGPGTLASGLGTHVCMQLLPVVASW